VAHNCRISVAVLALLSLCGSWSVFFIIKVMSAAFSILYKVLLPRIASSFFTALFLNLHLSFCTVITIITIRPKNVCSSGCRRRRSRDGAENVFTFFYFYIMACHYNSQKNKLTH